ncbi:Uncharacterized protein YR821_0498 [Yersinia ruckeri]|uniref:Uncharacterized protein n=1 Tax=Yersinia ruckeri TaxID=29486 RepID=A0A0A8V9C7_YERRU|nr:hypothetical protein yruck0001_32710 [Yersinia ruckeri ATCC 29473]QTD75430.1 Uncharacterized protein YR821_0498 [Yersinia ruckeri]CEK26327.1 hypothetical protein CSF007_2740 [Yersinia ruckeri]
MEIRGHVVQHVGERTWFLEDSAFGIAPVAATEIHLTAHSFSARKASYLYLNM